MTTREEYYEAMAQVTHDASVIDDLPVDNIVKSVLTKYVNRSMIGFRKYGKTLDRDDLSVVEWLTHLQEELMDATLYIERFKREMLKVKE